MWGLWETLIDIFTMVWRFTDHTTDWLFEKFKKLIKWINKQWQKAAALEEQKTKQASDWCRNNTTKRQQNVYGKIPNYSLSFSQTGLWTVLKGDNAFHPSWQVCIVTPTSVVWMFVISVECLPNSPTGMTSCGWVRACCKVKMSALRWEPKQDFFLLCEAY